ncbi:MAG: MBL fold metallo-hydrolase [Bacteroidaceae bacterium]|nr:MBL fold metallo-hydrolase [Bacteroidaceae bacterium]
MELKKFIVNPIQANCYLLWDITKEAVLIDCGAWFPQEREQIKKFVEDNGLTLKHHLNTHLHFDHIFGNAFVEESFGVKAEANDADWPWAANIKERVARFGVKYDEDVPPLGRVLNDGDEILFGGSRIIAISVPGHSPGSLAYYLPEEKMLFSGDALFRGSIGRTDFPDSNHRDLITTIREKILTLPEETVVYPGHDRETTIAFEKSYNMYLR